MKRCFKMLALSVLLIFSVSCSNTAQDMSEISETLSYTTTVKSETSSVKSTTVTLPSVEMNTEALPIVMVVLYENYAWGWEQEIKIIDSNGLRYYYGEEQQQNDFIWFDFDEKDWYNTLCNIAKLGEVVELSDEKLTAILDFSENYEDVSKNRNYKEYESTLVDYGNYYLYGIYYDEGKPKYVLLSQYGNGVKCLDNEDVINFVNQMIDFGTFPTEHKDFQY